MCRAARVHCLGRLGTGFKDASKSMMSCKTTGRAFGDMVTCPQLLCCYCFVDTDIVSKVFCVFELEGEQHLVFLECADIRVNAIGIVIEYVYPFSYRQP